MFAQIFLSLKIACKSKSIFFFFLGELFAFHSTFILLNSKTHRLFFVLNTTRSLFEFFSGPQNTNRNFSLKVQKLKKTKQKK